MGISPIAGMMTFRRGRMVIVEMKKTPRRAIRRPHVRKDFVAIIIIFLLTIRQIKYRIKIF